MWQEYSESVQKQRIALYKTQAIIIVQMWCGELGHLRLQLCVHNQSCYLPLTNKFRILNSESKKHHIHTTKSLMFFFFFLLPAGWACFFKKIKSFKELKHSQNMQSICLQQVDETNKQEQQQNQQKTEKKKIWREKRRKKRFCFETSCWLYIKLKN